MKKIFLPLLITLLIPISPVYAQSVSDVIGEEEETTASATEEVLEEDGDIKLKMPSQTDNPSYIITFIDPSEDEDGVQLEIDGDRYVEIESPYTLPALGIGDHILKFKYTDSEGATQTLERQLIIIPRPPILNSPAIDGTSITLTGTGLAGAELLLTASTGAKTFQYSLDIPDNGSWTYTFDEGISDEIISVQGITRKYGYASNFSDILTFEIGDVETIPAEEENPLSFSFEQLNSNVFKTLITTNLDLLTFSLSLLVLGIAIGAGSDILIRNKKEKKKLGNFREKINGEKKEEITLRELFEKDNGKKEKTKEKGKEEKKDVKEEPKEKEPKDEKKEEDVVISKNEFLKVYKDFDPDNNKGKEKSKFKISLTSKK